MALTDSQGAWVNRSSTIIPVYEGIGNFGAGHTTAGGTQIGSIYPGEFYTTRLRGNYLTYHEIRFRNSNGTQATGFIETLPQGHTYPEAAWVATQEPYHYYNSNGSSLVVAPTMSIGNVTYRIFTVKKPVVYRDPNGNNLGTLEVGTRLLTDQSTTGSTYAGYMLFKKAKSSAGGSSAGSWFDLSSAGYAFVDLGLSKGSEPASRAIW